MLRGQSQLPITRTLAPFQPSLLTFLETSTAGKPPPAVLVSKPSPSKDKFSRVLPALAFGNVLAANLKLLSTINTYQNMTVYRKGNSKPESVDALENISELTRVNF